MRKIMTYLLITLLLQSCEELTDWPLQSGNTNFIVVDGIITDEMQFQVIHISKPVANINEPAPAVSDATVLFRPANRFMHFMKIRPRREYIYQMKHLQV